VTKKKVWWLICNFQALNIIYVPIIGNVAANALANATARTTPLRDRFTIEILYKPSILYNKTNFHVFYDDEHIFHFIANADVFKDATIDEGMHE